MPSQVMTSIARRLLASVLGTALLGSTFAQTQERITLEIIGAVRMAPARELRRPDSATRREQAQPTREAPVGHASKAQ